MNEWMCVILPVVLIFFGNNATLFRELFFTLKSLGDSFFFDGKHFIAHHVHEQFLALDVIAEILHKNLFFL